MSTRRTRKKVDAEEIEKAYSGQIAAQIIKSPAEAWLKDEYLVYSLYTIRNRALLDLDGLKPVNRRILWSMFESKYRPDKGFVKAARIVGDVMGKYHPHGDASIADALARMAQNFSLRVPLIDKSGSVGFVTGDTPAAPRYWEARLTRASMELLKELDEGAVEMGSNFDGTHKEPVLLPVRWPNDIINGTKGLAVGFASNIPAHNPDEVMNACIALLRNPDLNFTQLMKIMPGPDFPTGGEILEIDGVKDYYETGTGRFTVRGRYTIEHLTRGRSRITFYELPYGVSVESVKVKVNELQNQQERHVKGKKVVIPPNKKLSKGLSDVSDLTDKKHGTRLVFETTQGTNPLQIINELFKLTPLQSSFSVNNTVLIDNFPVQVTVLDMLKNFLAFRRDCTEHRSRTLIEKNNTRIHQLDAILAALLDIDKAIEIIRHSSDAESARKKLKKFFKLDDEQADYILAMQLRRLTRADSVAVKKEKAALDASNAEMNLILSSDDEMKKVMEKDLKDTLKVISSPRRSVITGMTAEEFKEQTKEMAQVGRDADKNLPVYVTRFVNGSILRTETPFAYTPTDRRFVNSPVVEQIRMRSQDDVVLIGDDGIGRKVPMSFLIEGKLMKFKDIGIDIPRGVSLVGLSKFEASKSDVGLILASRSGDVKLSRTDFPLNKNEFPVFSLSDGDRLVSSLWVGHALTGYYLALVSKEGNVLLFDSKNVRATGSKAGGVKGMKLKNDKDEVIYFSLVNDLRNPENSIVTYSGETVKRTPLIDIPTKGRGGMGVATQQFKKGETSLVTAYVGKNAVAAAEKGTHTAINLPPLTKRVARGVDLPAPILLGASEVVAQ